MSQIDIKQVIVVRTDLKMRRGKEAAQVAHASMEWLREHVISGYGIAEMKPTEEMWFNTGHAKIVVGVDTEIELLAIYDKACKQSITVKKIIDLGFTEFHGKPTLTAIALGPDYTTIIDPITCHLKLR